MLQIRLCFAFLLEKYLRLVAIPKDKSAVIP